MKTFWRDLKNKKSSPFAKASEGQEPFFALAPMEDVTDTVFRRVVASVAPPDVFFTEFTSVEGLLSVGGRNVGRRLEFTEEERPIIAQIWGLKPENFYKAAQLLVARGFDGIDINMGCPAKDVTKIGACSALIKNPTLAKEIIAAVKEGIAAAPHPTPLPKERENNHEYKNDSFSLKGEDQDEGGLPVSVKTRIGYSTIATEEWIGFLLEQNLDALTIHGRTVKEMSRVPAHWDEIGKTVRLRNEMKKRTVIIGNGGVKSLQDGKEKAMTTGVDGVMIGTGIFENAWIFKEDFDSTKISIQDRISILLFHINLYEKEDGEKHAFQTLKKFFKIYIRGFDGAGELRGKLMEARDTEEVRSLLKSDII